MRKYSKKFIMPMLCIGVIFLNVTLVKAAPYLLYEKITKETIAKSVVYTFNQQVTTEGLRDIHILQLPANDPYIKVNNTSSIKDFNKKESTASLLNNKNAIAGVNGDFFNMSGGYSIAEGATVYDGKVISTDNMNNMYKNEYSTFYTTKDGNPFIDYVKTDIDFLNNGVENIKVFSMNKVTDMEYASYIDGNAMSDTSPIDAKFENLFKVVIENNVVTYISKKGETVKVPSNGYVIVIKEASAEYFLTLIKVGDKTEIKINANMDYSAISTAIGGGGKLLQNGQVVYDNGFVAKGRQPRTAVGYSKDKSQIIMVVVDGRTHSIGATQEELASIIERYGAYNAMHLDGGGSSTMAIKKIGETKASTVNTVSEGSERKVINALGIYNDAPIGEIKTLAVKFQTDKVISGTGVPYEIYGLDEYFNRIEIEKDKVVLTSDDEKAIFKDSFFYPSKTGTIKVSATFNGFSGESIIKSYKVSELVATIKSVKTDVGNKTQLVFEGKTTDGFSRYIYTGVNYEVVPSDLGTMEGDYFVAKKEGKGYIKSYVGDIALYLDVTVGFNKSLISSFDSGDEISYLAYPENTVGSATYSTINILDGSHSIELAYQFAEQEGTQAAYINFNNKISLTNNPSKIKIGVFGDNSNNWLRLRLRDAKDNEITLDITKEINFTGFKEFEIYIPTTVAYPVSIERIYVASVNNIDTSQHKIYIDKLTGYYDVGGIVQQPESSKFTDTYQKNLASNPDVSSFDLTVVGDVALWKDKKPDNYNEVQNKAMDSFIRTSTIGFFAGETDINELPIPFYQWSRSYAFYRQNNVGIIHMSSATGNFYSTNLEQWQNFAKDIVENDKKHIIIETDLNPLNLKSKKEFELLHDALITLKESGKNIFVISTEGTYTNTTIKDGIRYINLGSLFKANDAVNESFKVLRFRITGDNIYYDLQSVF